MERYLFGTLGVMLAASIGAYMLYVPIMPVTTVTILLMGFVLVFALGVHLGTSATRRRGMRIVSAHRANSLGLRSDTRNFTGRAA